MSQKVKVEIQFGAANTEVIWLEREIALWRLLRDSQVQRLGYRIDNVIALENRKQLAMSTLVGSRPVRIQLETAANRKAAFGVREFLEKLSKLGIQCVLDPRTKHGCYVCDGVQITFSRQRGDLPDFVIKSNMRRLRIQMGISKFKTL